MAVTIRAGVTANDPRREQFPRAVIPDIDCWSPCVQPGEQRKLRMAQQLVNPGLTPGMSMRKGLNGSLAANILLRVPDR